MHLAAETSGRQPELFVVGGGPIGFLQTSKSSAAWALDRFPTARQLFLDRFGSLEMRVADFTAGPGARVRITDLTPLVPELTKTSEGV